MRVPNLNYTIEDEYNQRKVVVTPYDPLHDPHLLHYLGRPIIKKHLEVQGFLKHDNDVICNLKSFNEFRKYLGVNHNERLNQLIRTQDKNERAHHDDLKTLRAFAGGKKLELQKAIDEAIARRNGILATYREQLIDKFRRHETQRVRAEQAKAHMLKELRKGNFCRENMRRIAYDRSKLPNIEERRTIIQNILRKEEMVSLRRVIDRVAVRRYRQLRKLHETQGLINRQNARKGVLNEVQTTFKVELKRKADKYNQRMIEKWNHLPKEIVERRKEKARIDRIVRKYFYRWLNNVVERRQLRQETKNKHQSHWNVSDTMDTMNHSLCGSNRIRIEDIKSLIDAGKKQIAIEETWETEEDTGMFDTYDTARKTSSEELRLKQPRMSSRARLTGRGKSGYESDRDTDTD